MKFSKILKKDLRRSLYRLKLPGFSRQLYQRRNSLTSISHGTRPLSRNTYSKDHRPVPASYDIRSISFSQDLMILVICAHTTLTHFSVPCFDKFFKHFKRFCGLNISRKQITNFWSTRSKTFCAKFIIIWSSTMRLFWCCARFDLTVSDFLKTFFIYLGFRLFFVLYISAQRYLSL